MEICNDFVERNVKSVERGRELLLKQIEELEVKKFTHVGRQCFINGDYYVIECYEDIEDQYFLNMCIESRNMHKDELHFTSGWVNGNMFRKRIIEKSIDII